MRNLIEFPLEPNELIEALDWAIDEHNNRQLIGGMHGYALHSIKDLLLPRPWVAEDVCIRANKKMVNGEAV